MRCVIFRVDEENGRRAQARKVFNRGIGTVLDWYNFEDMRQLSEYWLKHQREVTAATTGTALRD